MDPRDEPWRGRLEIGAALALGLAAIACLVGFVLAWPEGPAEEAEEVVQKAWACGAVTAMVALASLPRVRLRRRLAGGLLVLAGAAGVAAWCDFGALHGAGFVHDWEQFHHRLGSRYFAELGYDGLYAASIAAQLEGAPQIPVGRTHRDLRTDEVRDTIGQLDHVREVRRRFGAQRWVEFVADHDYFVERHGGGQLDDMRRDHGFNATPAWAALGRLAGAFVRTDRFGLHLLGLLDPLLLAIAFVLVFRAFGARVGCLSLALLGLGYASRFHWVGGAFLRQDWLAAVLASVALLEKERPRAAGVMLGVAAGLRIFPVLLLFGPAVLAARALLRRERAPWIVSLGLGFGLGLAGMLALGSLAGRGPAAWPTFASEIARHTDGWLTNDVGLANLVLYDRSIVTGALVDTSLADPWAEAQAEIVRRREARAPALLALRVMFLALLAAAALRATPSRALAISCVAVFGLTSPTCYYWSLLAVVPLAGGGAAPVLALLLLSTGMYLLHPSQELFELRYGALSLGLAAVFAGWLLPDALRTLREGMRRAGGPAALRPTGP